MDNILTTQTLTTKEEAIQFLRNRKATSHTVEFSNIDFSGTHFNFAVDFSNCIFHGPANFSNAIFYLEVVFDLAKFLDGANFDRTTFRSSASFNECSFKSGARFVFASFQKVRFLNSTFQITAIFWNSFFNQDADFSHCIFDFPEGLPRAIDKEANFSWAIFQGRAIFTHARFFTPVYFWRTIFKENALFNFCVFDDEAKFGGRPSEVHFIKVKEIRDDSLRALEDRSLFDRDAMLQFGEAYIFQNVYSTGQLKLELDSIGSMNEKEKTAIISEWELGHYNVFQENKTVSFGDAHFNKLKICSFKYINSGKVILDKNISGTKEDQELFTSILTQNSYDFFISYAHEQKDFAGKLHERLSLFGKMVWFDADEINKGEELLSSIKKGLANSSFFIMIFSKEYFVKNWTKKEFDLVKLNIDKLIPIWHNISADDVRNINKEFADFADIIAFKSQDYSPDLEKLSLDIIFEAGKR